MYLQTLGVIRVSGVHLSTSLYSEFQLKISTSFFYPRLLLGTLWNKPILVDMDQDYTNYYTDDRTR